MSRSVSITSSGSTSSREPRLARHDRAEGAEPQRQPAPDRGLERVEIERHGRRGGYALRPRRRHRRSRRARSRSGRRAPRIARRSPPCCASAASTRARDRRARCAASRRRAAAGGARGGRRARRADDDHAGHAARSRRRARRSARRLVVQRVGVGEVRHRVAQARPRRARAPSNAALRALLGRDDRGDRNHEQRPAERLAIRCAAARRPDAAWAADHDAARRASDRAVAARAHRGRRSPSAAARRRARRRRRSSSQTCERRLRAHRRRAARRGRGERARCAAPRPSPSTVEHARRRSAEPGSDRPQRARAGRAGRDIGAGLEVQRRPRRGASACTARAYRDRARRRSRPRATSRPRDRCPCARPSSRAAVALAPASFRGVRPARRAPCDGSPAGAACRPRAVRAPLVAQVDLARYRGSANPDPAFKRRSNAASASRRISRTIPWSSVTRALLSECLFAFLRFSFNFSDTPWAGRVPDELNAKTQKRESSPAERSGPDHSSSGRLSQTCAPTDHAALASASTEPRRQLTTPPSTPSACAFFSSSTLVAVRDHADHPARAPRPSYCRSAIELHPRRRCAAARGRRCGTSRADVSSASLSITLRFPPWTGSSGPSSVVT